MCVELLSTPLVKFTLYYIFLLQFEGKCCFHIVVMKMI